MVLEHCYDVSKHPVTATPYYHTKSKHRHSITTYHPLSFRQYYNVIIRLEIGNTKLITEHNKLTNLRQHSRTKIILIFYVT
jgi:hypothetical protein